jgi:hypothetical protein
MEEHDLDMSGDLNQEDDNMDDEMDADGCVRARCGEILNSHSRNWHAQGEGDCQEEGQVDRG